MPGDLSRWSDEGMIKRTGVSVCFTVAWLLLIFSASAGEVVDGSPMTEWWIQGPGVRVVLGILAALLCLIVLGMTLRSRRLDRHPK